MKEINCDILIVGAGLTGLLTAQALSSLKLNIVIIDKFNFSTLKDEKYDLRTTAISEGSKEFLENINIWKKMKNYAEPIKNIKVIDRKNSNKLDFINKIKDRNLGYIVKNNVIKSVILKSINLKKNIQLINLVKLTNIYQKKNLVLSESDNLRINSKLLIAADGKNSFVRNYIKTPVFKKNYKQKALVVNFHHTKNHNNIAYELFLKSGPLAILPMKKMKKNFYLSSLIWSHTPSYINSLSSIDKNILILILQEKINQYVGQVKEILDVQSFNLSAHLNSNFFHDRIMYLGDSAHSIHPIAGQGWNLGIRDIKNCLFTIKSNLDLGLDIGSLYVCKQYHDLSYYDSYSFFEITDKLNLIFLNDSKFINNIRKKGFKLINNQKFLKNYITNFAMGF